MCRSLGNTFAFAALLMSSALLVGCISHTTVYEDEDPVKVKTPKPTTSKSNSNPPIVIVHQHQFYYYPSCQVYRDLGTNYWYWQEGGLWKKSRKLPKTIVIGNEAPHLVLIDSDQPKDHHKVIVKTYPPKSAQAKSNEVGPLEVQAIETAEQRKSLPPQAKGLAKGHDKQNARAEAELAAQSKIDQGIAHGQGKPKSGDSAAEDKSHDHGNGNNGKHDQGSNGPGSGNGNSGGQGAGNADGKGEGKKEAKENAGSEDKKEAKDKPADKESGGDKDKGADKDKDSDKGDKDHKDKADKGKGKK